MKKLLLSLLAAAILITAFAVVAYSALDSFNPDDVEIKTADKVGIYTEAALEITLDFYLPYDETEYLKSKAETMRVYAVVLDYEKGMKIPTDAVGSTVDMKESGEITIGEKRYAKYTVSLGLIAPENYNKSYAVRGYISYTLNGSSYKVASDYSVAKNVITPYDRIYAAYSDRSNKETDIYKYDAGDGTFATVEDLNALRKILSSALYIEIKDGRAVDTKENEYYRSIYKISYFDGVLTLSLEGQDFPEWLLSALYINGERRYFEIYNEKVKLVV